MQQKRDLAIVLRSLPYEERHKIVTALTEKGGQITVMAHNAVQSRRYGGSLEPFTAGQWLYSEKPGAELGRLEETKTLRAFEGVRKDFERLSLASAWSELMLRLAPKHQACSDLFKLHSNALAVLDEEPAAEPRFHLSLLNAYLSKLLQWSGSQPRIFYCLVCGISVEKLDENQHLSCIVPDAGWACMGCRATGSQHIQRGHDYAKGNFSQSMLTISPRSVLDFHLSLAAPIRQVPGFALGNEAEQKELFRFLEALFIYHIPGFDQRPLKSLRFLGLESSVQSFS